MRRMVVSTIGLLTMTLFLSSPAHSGSSDQEKYHQDIERVGGLEMGDNPRAMCLCVNGIEQNVVGYMIISHQVTGGSVAFVCKMPTFNNFGVGGENEITGSYTCEDFIPMVH